MLFFGPLWIGLMAALNGRRLGVAQAAWRPIAISVAAAGLTVVGLAVFPSDFSVGMAFWLVHLPALGPLVSTDLLDQHRLYRTYRASGGKAGGWVMPVVVGALLYVVLTITGKSLDRASVAYDRGDRGVRASRPRRGHRRLLRGDPPGPQGYRTIGAAIPCST